MSVHPLRNVDEVEATPLSPSQGDLPANSLRTESTHSPAQHPPSAVSQFDNVPAASQSSEPTTTIPSTESTPSLVVHTPSVSVALTESGPVHAPRKKRLVPRSALSSMKRTLVA